MCRKSHISSYKRPDMYMRGVKTHMENQEIGTKKAQNYAKLVLGEGGSGSLDRIVDISAGNYGSTAVNEFGWGYAWGNGSFGEIGNGFRNSKLTPTRNLVYNLISVSMGSGHTLSLMQSGLSYTWGRNTYGELGIRKYRRYSSSIQ